jgi:hypothetical protein
MRPLKILAGFAHSYGDRLCAAEALKNLNEAPNTKGIVIEGKSNRLDYWEQHGSVSFVASPYGHGLDTHRIWEALILGCVPIVVSSPLDKLYQDFPIAIIRNWEELNSIGALQSMRDKIIMTFGDDPLAKVREKLFTKYWVDLISKQSNQSE